MRAPLILGKSVIARGHPTAGLEGNNYSYPSTYEKGAYRQREEREKRGGGHTGGSRYVHNSTNSSLYVSNSDRSPARDRSAVKDRLTDAQPMMPTPVILARAKVEPVALNCGTSSVTVPTKELATSQVAPTLIKSATAHYQIVSKPVVPEASLIPSKLMTKTCKLLDDSLNMTDDLTSYLLDQSNFLVVSVVGSQGSGKSTLASLLANPSIDITCVRSCVFPPQRMDQLMCGSHATGGIDIFVTSNRLIVLDCQPLMSPSVMDTVIGQEKKFLSEFGSTENLMEVESLQLLTFITAVSHVILLVQDTSVDPNLLRLLQACEMLKPSSASSGANSSSGNIQHHFPHIVFVHNRAPSSYFLPQNLKKLQKMYVDTFSMSYLEHQSQVGLCNGIISPALSPRSCGTLVNLFLLPDFNRSDGPASFDELIREMRRQIVAIKRLPISHAVLTEKTWYQYTCRMWDSVQKSGLFVEYSRLLP